VRGILRRTAVGLGLAAVLAAGGTARAQPVTPEMVAAARGEGVVNFYCSADLQVCEQTARAFERAYPGIQVKVERSGSERLFQRIGQEFQARVNNADVVNSSDSSHFIVWKRGNMLARWVPEDVARHFPAEYRDAGGYYASWRLTLSVMAFNHNLLPPAEAPRRYRDLLDARWSGRLVKAHPSYSGVVVTTTHALSRALGWEFYEGLARQQVLQVQSATEPPRKIGVGERQVQVEGTEYTTLIERARGAPITVIYAEEGSPMIDSPSAVLARAPHPNAARVFQSWLFTREAQQMIVDLGWLRSAHPQVRPKEGMRPLSEIRLFPDDAAGVERGAAEIKRRYSRIFGR